jgi:hypothetical protein
MIYLSLGNENINVAPPPPPFFLDPKYYKLAKFNILLLFQLYDFQKMCETCIDSICTESVTKYYDYFNTSRYVANNRDTSLHAGRSRFYFR